MIRVPAHPLAGLALSVATLAGTASAVSGPHGQIDSTSLVATPLGSYGGVAYTQYGAMFDGVTSNNRPFRVPCQIVAPTNPVQGSGILLFDWLVPSTIPTIVGQEQADARYTLGDEFLFGRGIAYATVRCDPAGLGKRSAESDPTRPWSDGLLDTSSEFILSAGHEFDIVVAYVKALRTDPTALAALGTIERRAAFGYSASGYRLRGLLRLQAGVGLFDFSLVGGTGNGFDHPRGNSIGFSSSERDPLPGAGLEIDFQSETDVVLLGAPKTRREGPSYRVYQFAGASHLRDLDAYEFGLAEPATANTADWVPFFRALFVAANDWCDGIQPPPSLWLGALNEAPIVRDADGNALVTHVGGLPTATTEYRLPCVAVGEAQYIPVAPAFDDGTFLGMFRSLAGGHVDLSERFTDHADYVALITAHARRLEADRYLLTADADAIIAAADASDIGN